ncbi:MAG TPA: hypothetical protein DD381_11200 [Lentisphaeria bacterium]|nr:MAG: hypothetical protein A2X47_00405 [Lentisphaerae bacterium GWF2_38_69]HBM16895.1 hypothetical protein [Lentisphaeria bacterium]
MKKTLFATALLIIGTSYVARADFVDSSQKETIITVEQVKTSHDDSWVKLKGQIVKQLDNN